MRVVVNGQAEELPPQTVAEVLAARGLDARAVAVELNGQIPPREEWSHLRLRENDRLEIVRMLGGG